MTKGAMKPLSVSAPTKVVVFQWPCGTPMRRRSPFGQRPRLRAMLVEAQVSSMKKRRSGSRSSWASNQSRVASRQVGAVLLACMRRLFLSVIPCRRNKRQSPATLAKICLSASADLISTSVMSRFAAMIAMIVSAWLSIAFERGRRPKPEDEGRLVRAPACASG